MIEQFKEGLTYSDEVKNAVRYGYQYRKEAEGINQSLKYCLTDTSDVLLWLGNAILGGYIYDKIKILAKNIQQWLKENKKNVDQETATILEKEEELKIFYEYVVEYNEHRMSVTEEQKNYIKEEIFADYGAAKEVDIMKKKGRMATLEERKVIYREVLIYAEKLTEIKKYLPSSIRYRKYIRSIREIRVRLKKKTILLSFNNLTSCAANGKELVGKTTLHHEP